jgi:hypothetical protein
MLLLSDPCAATDGRNVFESASTLDPRLYGNPGNRSSAGRPRDVQARTGTACAQVETFGFLFGVWAGIRSIGSLFSEVVANSARPLGRSLTTGLVCAIALIGASAPSSAADITDITFKTGFQLRELAIQSLEDPNVKAAWAYFEGDKKLKPDFEGLVEIKFRVDKSPDLYTLFFMPFYEGPNSKSEQKHLVLLAQAPKTSRVLLGDISTETKSPEVIDERVAVEGKVQEGHGQLKSFFKCSVVGCVPAGLGCLYGGPAWLPCFCLWCGGAVVSCGLLELFFP